MTTKSTTSYRLSDMAKAQIEELTETLKMSRTELLSVAIDRMYQQEIVTNGDGIKDAKIAVLREKLDAIPVEMIRRYYAATDWMWNHESDEAQNNIDYAISDWLKTQPKARKAKKS